MTFYYSNLQGQSSNDWIPSSFQQYDQSSVLFNPSTAYSTNNYEIISGYKMFTNFRKRNNQFHAGLLINPDYFENNEDSLNHKSIGLFIQSENEASILHFNRLNALYSYKIHLKHKLDLSLGATINLSNYVIDATPRDPGGSDIALSGNLGMLLSFNNTNIGVSSGSIFNSVLEPTREVRVLKRHYYIHANHTFNITLRHDIELSMFHIPTNIRGQRSLAFSTYYVHQQNYYAGAAYRHLESYLLILGLKKLEFNNQSIRFSVSYSIPSYNGSLRNSNIWEFQFGYLL